MAAKHGTGHGAPQVRRHSKIAEIFHGQPVANRLSGVSGFLELDGRSGIRHVDLVMFSRFPGRLILRAVLLWGVAAVLWAGAARAAEGARGKAWVLEYSYEGKSAGGASHFGGCVEFDPVPEGQKFRVTGPLSVRGTNLPESRGTLVVEGRVEKGNLVFVPSCSGIAVKTPQGSFPIDLFEGEDEISMPFEDGGEKVFDSGGHGMAGKVVWRLKGGEEQEWKVVLTGQETDDMGGKTLWLKTGRETRQTTVDFGVRFDYKLVAQFTLRKRKGKWVYENGKILEAKVGVSQVFDPAVFSVPEIKCKNPEKIAGLKGRAIRGEAGESGVRLFWPNIRVEASAKNKMKIGPEPKEKIQQGYSLNWFVSDDFLQTAASHVLPLKDGAAPPFEVTKKSANDRFRPPSHPPPVSLRHRYVMEKIR
jgi:hypothetical protein